jgi:hypothetical protein
LVLAPFGLLTEDYYFEKTYKNYSSLKPPAFEDCKFTKLFDVPTISPSPINHPTKTDFTNVPTSKMRPTFTYEHSQFEQECKGDVQPTLLTIVLLYHNQSEYQKMFEDIYAQSFQLWELQIIVPSDEAHNHELEVLLLQTKLISSQTEIGDERVFIHHLPSSLWHNPALLKNTILQQLNNPYILYWNGKDLLEPTFLEKCIWYLETHPDVSICGSHFISFDGKNSIFFIS